MLDEDGNRLSLSTKSQQLVNKIWNLTELTFKMNKYIGAVHILRHILHGLKFLASHFFSSEPS